MIKVTKEFATEAEAIAWLGGNSHGTTAVLSAPVAAPTPIVAPAPAPLAPPVPAPGAYAPPPAPAPVAAPVAAPAIAAAPAGDSGGITAAQLGAAAQNYSKLYKAAATKQVFARFGIAKIGDAHPSIYPQLLAALTPQAA